MSRLELSKNLLQMKFMQRTKANVERELNERNDNKLVGQELLEICRKEGDRYMTTNSFLFCENLRYGRMSYKGMNPEIERLMESKEAKHKRQLDDQSSNEMEISNKEMAKVYKKLKTKIIK